MRRTEAFVVHLTSKLLDNNGPCFGCTGCGEDDCGEEAYGVCHDVEGECEIECGGEHYREGDYCYYCGDIVAGESYCQACDEGGSCAVCRDGVDLEHGECVNRQQEAIEKIAGELRGTGVCAESEGPDIHGCVAGEECRGRGCDQFVIVVDGKERVVEMFATPQRKLCLNL